MNIPFSPPFIDEDVIAEVTESLQSGWITTGPKVLELESETAKLAGVNFVACVNSWTSGALLLLKWLGVGPGDEVIVPAYTYSATALVVLHVGAIPIMVDVNDDFTINPLEVEKAITSKTKLVFAVDFAGFPCDYDSLNAIVNSEKAKKVFTPANNVQKKLGRILLASDAAHSIGALYRNQPAARHSDVTIYSYHAVKNVTTAEGGAVCLNLPEPFLNEMEHKWFKLNSLNGQTKDAFTKTQAGGWKYDIISPGLKINMPDVCAAIGLAQIRKYPNILLPERRQIFKFYSKAFSKFSWAIFPPLDDELRQTSCHLYALRIKGITESQRDSIIDEITKTGVSVNVHFIPMPMLTLFKDLGYKIVDYPQTYANYACEISLPIYPQLSLDQLNFIVESVKRAVETVIAQQK